MRSPGSWREFSENVWHKVSVARLWVRSNDESCYLNRYINALDVFTMCAQIADDAVHMSHAARLQDSTSTCPVRFVRFFFQNTAWILFTVPMHTNE